MRYFILGIGYTGQRILEILRNNNHQVAGTRTESSSFSKDGKTFPFNLSKPKNITKILSDLGWLDGEKFHLIFTAGPPRKSSIDDSVKLVRSFLEVCPLDRLRSFHFISSTSVYGDANGQWVSEASPLEPVSQSGKLKVKVEKLLNESLGESIPLTISRPGGIYGPDRNGFHRYLSDYELVEGGEKWTNRIHVYDLARAVIFLTKREDSEIANTVDGNPVQLGELVRFVHEKAGKDPDNITNITWKEAEERYSEMRLGLLKPNKRVSSEKLKKLGFAFQYPTVYEGLEEIYEENNEI